MLLRLLLVAVLAVAIGGLALRYRRSSARDAALGATTAQGASWPAVERRWLDTERSNTWLIFTTPVCASCAQVQADLERAFPHHAVQKVDATEHLDLADRYEVRRAPTTLLAERDGTVLQRLVGPEAVRSFIGAAEEPALDRPDSSV